MDMNQNQTYSYVEVVCEARVNSTEKEETIVNILNKFVEGNPFVDNRFDGKYLVVRSSGDRPLQLFGDWVRQAKQLVIVRKKMLRSIVGNVTALYFNRQAAAKGKIAIVDINDNPPLGSIALQVISDNLQAIVDLVAPRTFKARELTSEEMDNKKRKRS